MSQRYRVEHVELPNIVQTQQGLVMKLFASCRAPLMRRHSLWIAAAVIGSMFIASITSSLMYASDAATETPPFEPNWASVAQHQAAPEWFRDAKLGIYFHWGVYSMPAFGNEWYPRWMYFEGTDVYKHHLAKYGPPSEFGYHDFVPMFKAEKFDADDWASLFKQAGARFAGPVAEHHDGFAMWKSKATPWNAADMGPKRDITGELEKAIHGQGMKFITTFHHARNLQRPDTDGKPYPDRNYGHDSHYPAIPGMPTSSDDPLLVQLYGRMPEAKWLDQMWLGKLKEVIDGYHPDLIWFDGWLDRIPEEKRAEFAAYYFNAAAKRNQNVAVARKEMDLPDSMSIRDFEKGRMKDLTDSWWLTDDTISKGSWCYTEDLQIKPMSDVLHVLIDIVSKRGVLLLNISPKADGTIPDNQREILLSLGDWLHKYGEAIYDTRPWVIYGEGPTQMDRGGHFVKSLEYTADDVRYTRSKDGSTIYATLLGKPKAGSELRLTSFGDKKIDGDLSVNQISLLGSPEDVDFHHTQDGLAITVPDNVPDETANVFKLVVSGTAWAR
jgi:alpha-L-fucosidase